MASLVNEAVEGIHEILDVDRVDARDQEVLAVGDAAHHHHRLVHDVLEAVEVGRCHLDDEAALRLGEQGGAELLVRQLRDLGAALERRMRAR